jgi:hypothetical protein
VNSLIVKRKENGIKFEFKTIGRKGLFSRMERAASILTIMMTLIQIPSIKINLQAQIVV